MIVVPCIVRRKTGWNLLLGLLGTQELYQAVGCFIFGGPVVDLRSLRGPLNTRPAYCHIVTTMQASTSVDITHCSGHCFTVSLDGIGHRVPSTAYVHLAE